MFSLIYVIVCCLMHGSSADYIGAVVEYNHVPSENSSLTVEENLEHYLYQIGQASVFGAQIIVFPEYGLTGLVQQPEDYAVWVPDVGTAGFLSEAYVLLTLSNAAIERRLHVVANLLEKANDTSNNTLYYNTNVVFSDNGTLVAKYRKINLNERESRLTPGNETSIFVTSFGTFALVTGTDIWFAHPSQSLLLNNGVTDVIFPTAWNSTFPFQMSLSVQVGYALANRVNLLAANINNPSSGFGGSSIVNSEGITLRTILRDRSATNIAYGNVGPTTLSPEPYVGGNNDNDPVVYNLANYRNQTVFDYDSYVFDTLNLSTANSVQQICHDGFCCNFNISVVENSTDVYRLVAFNGGFQFAHKFCTVVACLNEDIASCGVRPLVAYSTVFRQITVWGQWDAQDQEFYRPISLRGNLEPAYNATYRESRTNETVGVNFNLTVPVNNIVVFGLFVKSAASVSVTLSVGLLGIIVIIGGFA